jgi:hypothetical protein
VQVGGDLGLAYIHAPGQAALPISMSGDQPHGVASVWAVVLGFVKQLMLRAPYLSELLDATKCAKITRC